MLVNTLNSLGTLGAFGTLGKHGPKDQYYQKAKEFTLCLDEIAKNYDRQISAMAASSSVGKQLAQSFATYRKVAAFHQPIFPIVEFLQKSTTWLTTAEDLNSKFFTSLNDKTFTPTKNNVRSHTSNLKAIKAKNIQNEKLAGVHPTLRREEITPKKTSEQCAFEIEEMTMSSLFTFWESYLEYFEEGQKLMQKVKDGVLFMKKLSADAAKTKRLSVKKIFGVTLEELAERDAPAYLPQVLENMLASISKLVTLEGIFRVSGSKTAIDSLRESIDSGVIPDFDAVLDPHTVPSLFKSFLRMMPIPLIPYENYEMVPNLSTPGLGTTHIVNHLKALVHSLPPTHYHLLGRLLSLCSKIVAEKATTKMTPSNLAVVIGPNIIRTPENPSNPESFGGSNIIVQLLIEHFAAIYPEKISAVHEENMKLRTEKINVVREEPVKPLPIRPEKVNVAHKEPVKPLPTIREQRAHGVTIDKTTVDNLNWEAQAALANQEQPAHHLSRSASVSSLAPDAADSTADAGIATKDAPTAFRPSTRPSSRITRSQTTNPPLPNGLSSARNAHKSITPGSFLAPTRTNGTTPATESGTPASAAPATPASPSSAPASPALASSAPASPATGASKTNSPSHSPKYPIIGYHPKTLPTPPLSTSPPSTSPPSPPSLAPRPSSPSSSPSPSSTPVSLSVTPRAPTASSSPASPAPPSPTPGKKVIIGKAAAKKPAASPASGTSSLPAFTLDPVQYAPTLAPVAAQQAAQTTQPLAQPAPAPAQQTPAQAAASTKGSFLTARPSARDAPGTDATLETTKAEILRMLSSIVTGQIRVVRGKFAEVNTIADGVPFIHVLKAVTPELDKIKKIMPTPPTFEKLPELPPDHTKFTRLKFTIDFALKDFTRALEHVGSFVAEHDNPAELVLLQNILQVISELHRILAFNINKL